MIRKEARELLNSARSGYWIEAVRERFPEGNMATSILDPQRAAWLPLLGLDSQAVALDIGSGYGAITHSLARCLGQVYSVEPIPERIEFTKTRLEQQQIRNVSLIQASATALPFFEESFDLIVANGILEWVGEWDLEGDPRSVQLRFLSTARRMLKKDGMLVIGIENRFGYGLFLGERDHSGLPYTSLLPRFLATFCLQRSSLPHHRTTLNVEKEYRTYTYSERGYRNLLAEAGFGSVSAYWADPAYNEPYNLIPLEAGRLIKQHFLDTLDHPGPRGRTTLRRRLKRAAAKLGIVPWIVPDFVLIGSKNPGRKTPLRTWFQEHLESTLEAQAPRHVSTKQILWAAETLPFHNKNIVQFWDSQATSLLAVGKAETSAEAGGLQAEFENLRVVGDHLRSVPRSSVSVPKPIASLRTGTTFHCLESSAKGIKYSRILRTRGYFESLPQVKRDFARLIQGTTELTRALQTLRGIAPIEPSWYRAPEDISNSPDLGNWPEMMRYSSTLSDQPHNSWIQHGDLSVENVFLDRRTGRIEVIDWAHLAGGLPPLYDVFSLILSTSYLDSSRSGVEHLRQAEYWKASFDDLFFSNKGFGKILGDLLIQLCPQFDIPVDSIPTLLVIFLVVRTNSYRSRGSSEQVKVHTDLLRYFLEAPDRAVFGRFSTGKQTIERTRS